MRGYLVLIVVPLIFFIDMVSKEYVEKLIPLGGSRECTSFFSIVHIRNYGGAFSLLSDSEYGTLLLKVVPLLIVGALLFFVLRGFFSSKNLLPVLLILGGALGNLYDRIFRGYVIDFLDFHYQNLHWPAFNVADASITCGVFLWILTEIKK